MKNQSPAIVNIHAAVVLAGIGFDQTFSRIIDNPVVITNSHLIEAISEGMNFSIQVASTEGEGITGAFLYRYRPAAAWIVFWRKRAGCLFV